MDQLLDYLDEIEVLLEAARKMPLGNKVAVDKERIFEIISEIRMNLPGEFKTAQRITADVERIIEEAHNRAGNILQDAEAEAKMLTNATEIARRANDQAEETREEVKREVRDMRLNAMDYADSLLAKAEDKIKELTDNLALQNKYVMEHFDDVLNVLYENRQELRKG